MRSESDFARGDGMGRVPLSTDEAIPNSDKAHWQRWMTVHEEGGHVTLEGLYVKEGQMLLLGTALSEDADRRLAGLIG